MLILQVTEDAISIEMANPRAKWADEIEGRLVFTFG